MAVATNNASVQLSNLSDQLLDFNQKLDIDLLDNVVGCMHTGFGQQVCDNY